MKLVTLKGTSLYFYFSSLDLKRRLLRLGNAVVIGGVRILGMTSMMSMKIWMISLTWMIFQTMKEAIVIVM